MREVNAMHMRSLLSKGVCAASMLLAGVGLAACTGQLGAVDGTDSADQGLDADAGDEAGLPEIVPCTDQADCPTSTTCRLSECLPACQAGGPACPEDYYCDENSGLCQRESVEACPCESPKFCSFGACISPPRDAVCDSTSLGDTVCSATEVCVDVSEVDGPEETQCWEMPACPADGDCPVGLIGSTCNDNFVVNKARVCLLGYCQDTSDCPEDWFCIDTGTDLGVCSGGRFGELCTVPGECLSGNCIILTPGVPGLCG